MECKASGGSTAADAGARQTKALFISCLADESGKVFCGTGVFEPGQLQAVETALCVELDCGARFLQQAECCVVFAR
jgi:hypothetical protein